MVMLFDPQILTQYWDPLFVHSSRIANPYVGLIAASRLYLCCCGRPLTRDPGSYRPPLSETMEGTSKLRHSYSGQELFDSITVCRSDRGY